MLYCLSGRGLGLMWLVLCAVLAAGCAQLPLQQREIVVPADKLNEALAKRLVIDKKLLDIFSVKIERPKLAMDAPAQRLRAEFELALAHPFSSRPLRGRAGISGALGYDAASYSVMLLDPKIETLQIDAVPPALKEAVSRLGSALGAELLAKYPLVSLREKDLAVYGQDYRVVGFEVLEDAVRVILRAKE